jgi:hypothetical protein
MIFVYQCAWALIGLFFGLLLVSPHHIIPTRSCTAKSICLLAVTSSLVGMMGFFQSAWFLVACASIVLIKHLINRFMLAVNSHDHVSTKNKEHKAMEHKS